MEQIVIRGRKVYPGHVAGTALVSNQGISTWGSLDERTGVVTARGHVLFGKSLKDIILVFPFGKGSSGWGRNFQNLGHFNAAPKAMLIGLVDTRTALGAVTAQVPSVTDFDIDPLTVIEDGDWVDVNADEGIVTVTKKK
jgi:predicted aconitase with swiveling domain